VKNKKETEAVGIRKEELAPSITEAATLLGTMGGRSTSEAKADAARENGKKGGRPKKGK
jgi:hypothetical protein